MFALAGFILSVCILIITIVEKFDAGGWLTVLITSFVVYIGLSIKKAYRRLSNRLHKTEANVEMDEKKDPRHHPHIHHDKPTAVFIVDTNVSSTNYAAEWVHKTAVGEVDSDSFSEDEIWEKQKKDIKQRLRYFVNHWHNLDIASTSYIGYGTDVVDKISELAKKIQHDFPNSIFFSTKLVVKNESIFTQLLYNETSYILQRRLHNNGHTMIIIPMNV